MRCSSNENICFMDSAKDRETHRMQTSHTYRNKERKEGGRAGKKEGMKGRKEEKREGGKKRLGL